jgi:transcriptional regulator with XRE-family HTH domain
MRALGLWVRRLRELSGLSQERLAELAGVSQGAVSRLEAGRQLATPMVVVARIGFVLLAAARERDSHLLDEGLGHLHGLLRGLAAGNPGFRLDRPSLADPRLRELGDIYRGASESQRRAILAAARALSGKGGADSIT